MHTLKRGEAEKLISQEGKLDVYHQLSSHFVVALVERHHVCHVLSVKGILPAWHILRI